MADVQTGARPAAATLITGFETALGRSIAVALARAGHRLCVVRSGGGRAEQGLAELPGHERLQHRGIASELLDSVELSRVARDAAGQLGKITGFVHLAVPLAPEAGAEEFDARRLAEGVERGAGAFLGLALALLPELFATQTGCLCALTPAPPPGSSYASSPLGSAALIGALIGAVRQVADRCAGTPLRSLFLHCEEPLSVPLGAASLGVLCAELAPEGAPAQLANGSFASLRAPLAGGTIELLRPAPPVPVPSHVLAAAAAPAPSTAAMNPAAPGAATPNAGAPNAADRVGERLAQTFRATFGLAPSVDLQGCVIGSVPRWDSLGHLKLMMEVERTLRVRLPADTLAKIQSYRDLEQAVRAQLAPV